MQLKQEYFAKRRDNYGATRGIHNWYENVWLASRTDMAAVLRKYGGLHEVTPSYENKIYQYEGKHPRVMQNHPYSHLNYLSNYNIETSKWSGIIPKELIIKNHRSSPKESIWEYYLFLRTLIWHRR